MRRNATFIVAGLTALGLFVWWAPWTPSGREAAPSFPPGLAHRLNEALDKAVADTGAPGAQAAVILADGSMWTGGAGFANIGQKRVMTPSQLVAIGSVTKVYIATLILRLAQDGRLGLDDLLLRWVPGIPNADGVTIREHLTHTSGLASDDPALPPVCDRGTCYSYSNSGFALLGRVAEAASGSPFAVALRRRILAPLGLSSTFFPSEELAARDSAMGYRFGEPKLAVDDAAGTEIGRFRGGLVSTAADTAKFAHALFTGSVLDPSLLGQMLDFDATRGLPGTSDCMGQGMATLRHSGDHGESWFHGGFTGFFRTWVEHFPQQEVTVAVVANSDVPIGKFTEPLIERALVHAPVVKPATSEPRFDGFPSWAPDGKQLAWTSERGGRGDLFVGSLDGSAPMQLTSGPANDLFPRWAPDGKRIAFSSDRSGEYEIYVMNADGTGVAQITHNDWVDLWPAWSPDGAHIAYINGHEGQHIHVMAPDGRGDRQVSEGHGNERWPAWSPDGTRLVYESGGAAFVIPATGGQPVRVPIPQIRVISEPSWWPGTRIIFAADLDVWAVAEDGSRLRRLTATSTEEASPVWSPDGTTIAYQIGRWEDRVG